ncbi:MAG TPA: hypothetical protein VKH19_01145 [Gemmatimonadaceae bacterium]|nr:hypothetical protein [Gemmatimonadaceae bacterium]
MTAIGTTSPDEATCPHGKRAGISVCLYCRQEARQAARRRRNQMLVRVGGLLLASGVIVAVIATTLIAVAPWSRRSAPQAAELAAPKTPATSKQPAAKVALAKPAVAAPAPSVMPVVPAARGAAVNVASSVSPVVAEGRTDFGDSVYVERAGGEVTVHFDNAMLRTRFEEKFERTVRSTLPLIYGSEAQLALDSVVPGGLVRGDLLNELPTKGIELSLGAGRTLLLFPVTRPGLDGPLVVAYRAVPRT